MGPAVALPSRFVAKCSRRTAVCILYIRSSSSRRVVLVNVEIPLRISKKCGGLNRLAKETQLAKASAMSKYTFVKISSFENGCDPSKCSFSEILTASSLTP